MRLMARQTVPFGRRVHISLPHPLLHVLVAGQAKVRARCQKKAFQFRLVRTVALRALSVRYRSMLVCAASNRLLRVCVAGKTDCVLFFHDHPAYVASMGIVAHETVAPGERNVIDPPDLFFHEVAVALLAEIGTRGFQDLRNVGAVGSMTCAALSICHRLMGIIPGKVQFRVGMAGVADRVHPVLQHILEIRTMRIMTGGALPRVERHMGVLAFLRFFRLCVA